MEQNNKTQIFENYPIGKAFISLVTPTIISQIIMIIYNYAQMRVVPKKRTKLQHFFELCK